MQRAWGAVRQHIHSNQNAEAITGLLEQYHDDLVDAWVGTPENPGAITKMILAGGAAGNRALEQGKAPNPVEAKAARPKPSAPPPPDPAVGIDWNLINQQAYDFARAYSYALIKDLDSSTQLEVQNAVGDWIAAGQPLSALEMSMDNIFDNAVRAAMIAQTESTRAYNEGANQRYKQAGVKKAKWQTVNVGVKRVNKLPGDVCPICSPLHNTEYELDKGAWSEVLQQFVRQPAHPRCILPGNEVELPGELLAAAKSFYVGRCIEITLANGRCFTVTQNHPILTTEGWVEAQFLSKGGYVIGTCRRKRKSSPVNPDNDNRPVVIEEIYDTFVNTSDVMTYNGTVTPDSFHGDGSKVYNTQVVVARGNSCFYCKKHVPTEHSSVRAYPPEIMVLYGQETSCLEGQTSGTVDKLPYLVDIWTPNQQERQKDQAPSLFADEISRKSQAAVSDTMHVQSLSDGQDFLNDVPVPSRSVSLYGQRDNGNFVHDLMPFHGQDFLNDVPVHSMFHITPSDDISQGVHDNSNISSLHPLSKYPLDYSMDDGTNQEKKRADLLAREFLFRFASDVTLQEIVEVRDFHFSGHVYDLQVEPYELYICNGVIVKNCRCFSRPVVEDIPLPAEVKKPTLAETMQQKKAELDAIKRQVLSAARRAQTQQQTKIDKMKARRDEIYDLLYEKPNTKEERDALYLELEENTKKATKLNRDLLDKKRQASAKALLVDDPTETKPQLSTSIVSSRERKKQANDAIKFVNGVLSQTVETQGGADPYKKAMVHFRDIFEASPAATDRRAYYSSAANAVVTDKSDGYSTYVHEIGHHIEYTYPYIHQKALEFLEHRTAGEVPKPLAQIFPNSGYDPSEMTTRDKFKHPYIGKRYPNDRSTEVISMGLQYMSEDPELFAKDDPEYFNFIIGVLRGLI
jgi:hypothetical protein